MSVPFLNKGDTYMNIKVVVGAGYGDEGKGLMTDHFCGNIQNKDRVLNVKSNGGTQAGHTVCRFDKKNVRYNMWVFRNLGSGTIAKADTFLASRFIINCYELNDEISKFERHFGYRPIVFISNKCRVQFLADEQLNRCIEQARTQKHGTCGFGVFETVNRNHNGYELRMRDIYEYYKNNDKDGLMDIINELSFNYIECRVTFIQETENIKVDISKLLECSNDLTFKTVESIWELFEDNKNNIKLCELNELIQCGEYTDIVFECSQGLELNWGDVRNTPHVTASHTGLKNIIKELQTCDSLDMITDMEVCYITRSYKTKHGDGGFIEINEDIEEEYGLYDRTNVPNRFQGTLRFGLIDIARMSELINADFELLNGANILSNTCKLTKSLSVTHLDQTNEAVLTTEGNIFFKDFNAKSIINGNKTYYSFGEKSTDIVECES